MDCPICKTKGSIQVITKTENIPYFGEIMETVLKCQNCGYKHCDVICLDHKEPSRYTLQINKNNLNARVIKSNSATIEIPELGLKVEPGSKSHGYVSNIEGVLVRFQKAVETALNWAEDLELKENALKILEQIENIKKGEDKATLIIEDPFGNSMIIHDNAFKRKLKAEEIKSLKNSLTIVEN